jgi:hypothetical protein
MTLATRFALRVVLIRLIYFNAQQPYNFTLQSATEF